MGKKGKRKWQWPYDIFEHRFESITELNSLMLKYVRSERREVAIYHSACVRLPKKVSENDVDGAKSAEFAEFRRKFPYSSFELQCGRYGKPQKSSAGSSENGKKEKQKENTKSVEKKDDSDSDDGTAKRRTGASKKIECTFVILVKLGRKKEPYYYLQKKGSDLQHTQQCTLKPVSDYDIEECIGRFYKKAFSYGYKLLEPIESPEQPCTDALEDVATRDGNDVSTADKQQALHTSTAYEEEFPFMMTELCAAELDNSTTSSATVEARANKCEIKTGIQNLYTQNKFHGAEGSGWDSRFGGIVNDGEIEVSQHDEEMYTKIFFKQDSPLMEQLKILKVNSEVNPLPVCCQQIYKDLRENPLQICIETRKSRKKWFEKREKVITGTKCYDLYTFLYFTNPAMEHGTKYEPQARKVFQLDNPRFEIIETGLIQYPSLEWLGVTSDGEVFMDGKPIAVLEVKCPVSGKDSSIDEVVNGKIGKYLEEFNGNIILKKNHSYYGQVQLSMAITNAELAYFVMHSPYDQKNRVIEVTKDLPFLEKMLPELKRLYFCLLLPEICCRESRFCNHKNNTHLTYERNEARSDEKCSGQDITKISLPQRGRKTGQPVVKCMDVRSLDDLDEIDFDQETTKSRGRPKEPKKTAIGLPITPNLLKFSARDKESQKSYMLQKLNVKKSKNILQGSYKLKAEDLQHSTVEEVSDFFCDRMVNINLPKPLCNDNALQHLKAVVAKKKKAKTYTCLLFTRCLGLSLIIHVSYIMLYEIGYIPEAM
ncbi:hypothetical protein QAD02_021441 [Eretmocerus hayati]|uniref:Uncharacterized protein n=1 Tax=Eretmocerus hayati TaxID=131215 RepID=A0ACC2PRN1_9HYME|nr:hypothetical protein QAD02_021441 [Eretmocerus hayati]